MPFRIPHELVTIDFGPTPSLTLPGDSATDAVATPPASPLGRPASPIGDKAAWVTSDDYPSAALRDGIEGRTSVTLAIGADGRVAGCTVTASSGSSALDAAACRALQHRGRFRSARDDAGTPIATSLPNSVVWRLPRE